MANVPGFRLQLHKVGQSITPDDLSAMKFMVADKIAKRKLEEIETALDLWEVLIEKEIVSPSNVAYIKTLLVNINRQDLVHLLEADFNCKQGENLCEEFIFISQNIGRDWRILARRLGLSEADIEEAVEAHPKSLREQCNSALVCWQNRRPDEATRKVLISGLRRANNNLIADNLDNQAA